MKTNKLIITLILLLTQTIFLYSKTLSFNHLSTDDGLSQLSVNSLYIDEHGILWIGTRVGLNIFGGKKVYAYKVEKDNPSSIPSNFILKVTGNKNGKIYILSTDGVSEFNMETHRFKDLYKGKADCIYYKDKLYIGEKNIIFAYDEKNSLLNQVFSLPSEVQNINSMIFDDENNIYVGTSSSGIYKKSASNGEYTHIIKNGNITQIYIDNTNSIWAGSWEDGLYLINKNGEIKNFKSDKGKTDCISSNFVRAICQDNQGKIWIGTFNGIDKYDTTTDKFEHITSGSSAYSLSHSSVWCIEKDDQGTLWIGTYFGGVNYINPEHSIYNRYDYTTNEGEGLSSPIVGRMIEDNKGNLWIGTEGGGVNYFDKSTNTFKWLMKKPGKNNTISHNNIKSLYLDTLQNTLWIGTHTGGLNKYNLRNGVITQYISQGDKSSLPSNIIRDIEEYTKDSLIIATQNGICILNKNNGKCRQILDNLPDKKKISMVADTEFDREMNLWIAATGEGVYVYNIKSGHLKNYRKQPTNNGSISSNNINNITTDSNGNIWLCTSGGGLDLYIPETDNFKNYDKKNNNLSNDCVYQAAESPVTGDMLIITTDGFSILKKDKGTFINYNYLNGFPLNSINENALCITKNGEVFLGGIHNMVSFYEKYLIKKPTPYNIIPTGLLVNGQYVKAGDSTGILEKSLEYTDHIKLDYKQNMFSIEFAVTNYIPENNDKIIYKLKGFSNKWNNTRNTNEITYTNLHPGEYTLIIKPQNVDDKICKPYKLDIEIKAPFYQTTLAYIIYVLSASIIIWYLISIYVTRLRLSESLKLEQKHTENIKKENQAQLKLFTNISHEFRTPLTLIISQIETLIQNERLNTHINNKLSIIYQSSLQLRELITELLDYRKQELGYLKLHVSPNNIVDFLKENYLLFNDYATKKGIKIKFSSIEDKIELWYDPKHMQKVINNLLFNAIKHTKEGGEISIALNKDIQNIYISIADNGDGIPEKDINKIFDIFYQSETSSVTLPGITGSGIGLALVKNIITLHHGSINVKSSLNEGSTFTITLPLGNEHFTKDDIVSPNNTGNYIKPALTIPNIVNDDKREVETGIEENIADTTSKGKPSMLIVEDNEQIRLMLKEILLPYYNIRTVPDAEQALNDITTFMPDIIITDVMMPGMDGKELCRKIKGTPATSHIPVILLTAQTAVEQYIEGFQTGADDYITKPFNTQLLISRCNNLINSRILLQEKFSHQPDSTAQMLATNKIDKDILDKAISIIEANISNADFNMNIFAREMGMARTNLFTKIKAITGQTPNDFIINIRLKKGAYLLRNNPELNITEIAERIGFSSSRYFSKCFKDLYNISPLSYRKKDETNE